MPNDQSITKPYWYEVSCPLGAVDAWHRSLGKRLPCSGAGISSLPGTAEADFSEPSGHQALSLMGLTAGAYRPDAPPPTEELRDAAWAIDAIRDAPGLSSYYGSSRHGWWRAAIQDWSGSGLLPAHEAPFPKLDTRSNDHRGR